MIGCSNYNYRITDLKHSKVMFDDLPEGVKSFYIDPSKFGNKNASLIKFAYLGKDTETYQLKTIDTWIGPWVAYNKLIDFRRNISYRIDQGTPIPYVVYQNKLYLTEKFNVFTTAKDYSILEFTCYTLKDE